jgi:hypothetical protein
MALSDWLPGIEPDNGLTAKEEREYDQWYDKRVKDLKSGPGGKPAANKFINDEHKKYQKWRKDAIKRRDG